MQIQRSRERIAVDIPIVVTTVLDSLEGMIVDLSDGVITVTHGTDDVVLQQWTAERGDWDRIWETIYQLAKE